MREDLASQTLNTFYKNNNKKMNSTNMDKSNNWNDVGETDTDIIKDGMGNLDDEVHIFIGALINLISTKYKITFC